MNYAFYQEHFSDLCCYEDYLMRVDLMGKAHNDEEVLGSLPKCVGHKFVIAGGEVIWIDSNTGERIDDPCITMIEPGSFCDSRGIETLTIPSSVEIIGANAFYGCIDLKTVNLSKNLRTIDFNAFRGCINLETINIPPNLKHVGSYAFYNCPKARLFGFPPTCVMGEYAIAIPNMI